MAYDGRILRRARERFEADRERRREQFAQQRDNLFRMKPRLREIDAALRATTGHILSAALRQGTDPQPAIAQIRAENLRLQAEKQAILTSLRLPAGCLEETPACALCGDTGYRGGEVCRCLRAYYAQEQQKELSRMLDLGAQRFESFSLDWYSDRTDPERKISPRKNMEKVLSECREYAREFGRKPDNLLLFGAPGLGKTFLSAAIAREVSGAGYSVVYDTASHIFDRFEAAKFARSGEAEEDAARVLQCDLLILDDLGTEMTTAFVQSVLYQIVNTRLLEHRSTIVNTNLALDALSQRYTAQTASRMEGEYRFLPFLGEDIRKLKKQKYGL